MYSEIYPNLKTKYDFDNFETIIEALDKHFPDLFQLSVIEHKLKEGDNGSYMQLFDACMKKLTKLYTVGEVVKKIDDELLKSELRDKLDKQFLFVPRVGSQPSKQLGFFEKLAVEDLKAAEPLSYIDMVRLIQGLNKLKSGRPTPIEVIQLNHLNLLGQISVDKIRNNEALIINLNRDLKGTPKWGIVNLQNKHRPTIYCETPLTESEKADLQKALGMEMDPEQFLGATANSLPSTGYTALAWLDKNITQAWNLDVNADFPALLKDFTLTYFGGDVPGLTYSFVGNERDKFCTEAFKRALEFSREGQDSQHSVCPAPGLVKMATLAGLGQIRDQNYRVGDLQKAMQLVSSNRWNYSALEPFLTKGQRTLPPGLGATLSAYRGLLQEDGQSIRLTIPQRLDVNELQRVHNEECAKINANASWFERIYDNRHPKDSFYATTLVLALIRAKSKKRDITINLPDVYQLNQEEQTFIINSLRENPYVTELRVNANRSLQEIQAPLVPIFARNRWLAQSGYRPPLIDNYWRQAARYWLIHLNEASNLLQPKREHESFKRCVQEMGLQGLNEILGFLRDESEREFIEKLYGRNKPAFYTACLPGEYPTYFKALLTHLKSKYHFPYGELGISYQPNNEKLLIEVINELNKLDQFEKISFTECLKRPQDCEVFLKALIEAAHKEKWVGLIVIPELEDNSTTNETHRKLRVMYTLLNDIILHNRHLKAAEKEIRAIKEKSDFSLPGEKSSVKVKGSNVEEEEAVKQELPELIETLFADLNGKWPLKKGGVVQLQLQQQQEIEQVRQLQQEQQKVVINVIEEVIAGELIDYTNIDRLLRKFYEDFAAENSVNLKSAVLKSGPESLLKGFFHTWVNANPGVRAANVIQQMTPEAAKELLRKHTRLTSGLNPDNLPKGFYTQRSKDGRLILCYSPELSYVNPPNALTLDLSVHTPEAITWEGDFRQFNLDKYKEYNPKLDQIDWQNIILFAQMQPPKESYALDFEKFRLANHSLNEILNRNSEKIIKHWPVFLQVWQYAGEQGINQFIEKEELTLPAAVAKELLLSKASQELNSWAAKIEMDETYLRALGQVYYRYGEQGPIVLLSKFRQMEAVLGEEFFSKFNKHLLARSANFNCFMTESFFLTLDRMMDKLKSHAAAGKLMAWENILAQHMESVDWENIDALWRGFEYFSAELDQLGLELDGDEFDGLKSENMIVAMDRILSSLKQIPDLEQQKVFLKNLSKFDLTHGGVHYALQNEGFKYFDPKLELHDFTLGAPTYAPDLARLYEWAFGEESTLKINRTIASQAQFSQKAYQVLEEGLPQSKLNPKDNLMWLLHTRYSAADMGAILTKIDELPSALNQFVARHLHRATYGLGNKQLVIQLDALLNFTDYLQKPNVQGLLDKYPHGTFLEAVSILFESKRLSPENVDPLIALFNAPFNQSRDYPGYLAREGYKLATLFGIKEPDLLQQFYTKTEGLLPVIQSELRLLTNQLLSIDYSISSIDNLIKPQNWKEFLSCIEEMKKDPANAATLRIEFISKLNDQNIQFKYSKSGEFRAAIPADKPADLGFFVDHEDRIWGFMEKHIAVPSQGDAKESLKPIVRFLKKLQLNRTYLNEIEPLLSSLEKSKAAHYWSASYFFQMLRALQPENDQVSFPISLLKVMLEEDIIAPKSMDSVEKDFPAALIDPLQIIIKNTVFDRNQQAILAQLALREYKWQGNVALLHQIMNLLSAEGYVTSRTPALEILAKCKNFPDLEQQFENCRWLLQQPTIGEIADQWPQVSSLWLKALGARKEENVLFANIKDKFADDNETMTLVLHIIAFSALTPGLRDKETYQHELNKKAPKLVDRLATMSREDLIQLAKAYPQQPSPTADDIIRILKKQAKQEITWAESFDSFMRQPFPEPRSDYGTVAATRDTDLQRMIAETKISSDAARKGLSPLKTAQLTLIFSYLKRLESGTETIQGYNKPISKMSQKELAKAFQDLSKAMPQNDLNRAQTWAVLFEVLGRTTRKYPHLAQQFALIANDVGVETPTRILQLATGEGKSHFVAMRAARHVGQGKKVDVCTAKRTLAQRDLEDYQSLFDFLGIKTAYVHPKSSREEYTTAQITYSTLGDLSLLLDEQSYSGHPIEIDKSNRVALFDEFDFIRFEEGRKTEYNYARPTGKTPKQMTWFYQAVNDFYLKNQQGLTHLGEINAEVLKAFAVSLQKDAGDIEERQNLVRSILRDPLELVQWLQSAYEAHQLEWGISFTVREENIEVGDESYPMREIIPLSSDNQKMVGSTFSAGVHQLLAVRLNTQARLKGEAQNFHIHPESNIISSQVAAQLMNSLWSSWEGFTGTVSAAQAATLYQESGTSVLHVPTNQRDLRFWHKPGFYKEDERRWSALVEHVKTCIEKKQSMLFSCKNDKQVTLLKEVLEKHFTKEDLEKNFIFYTNEEHRSAAEVLDDKVQKEHWFGGKKQDAVGLVASGFGRGDNVGVEAVFLFDVNDTNDKLQKGGRTARNGAEGQVVQFYLEDEIAAEEERLWLVLAVITPDKVEGLKEQLQHVQGATDQEKCFERVMLLREYVFSVQNAANQGYHNAIAQISSWGMATLGKIEDPTSRQDLTTNFSLQLKKLDKAWIDTSGKDKLTVDEKIEAMEQEVLLVAQDFSQRCHELAELTEFQLAPRQKTNIQMVVPQPPRKPTDIDRTLAIISSVLARLPDLSLKDSKVVNIPQNLQRLAEDAAKLKQFAKQISMCASAAEFISKLAIAVKQLEAPSQEWTAVEAAVSEEIAQEDLFKNVSDKVRVQCKRALDILLPELQEQVIVYLRAKSVVSAETRINEALPIIEFLGTFTKEQQENYGEEYISNLGALTHRSTPEELTARLKNCIPMSYSHFSAIGNIVQKVLDKTGPVEIGELRELFAQLYQAVKAEPEQRLRMLTRWEAWIESLPKEKVKPFLAVFCYTMEHFEEGKNWDTFQTLVKKTQEWWNKGGESAYVDEIMTFWDALSKKTKNLPELNGFLQMAMKLGGTTWMKIINTGLNFTDLTFCTHLNQIKEYWHMLDGTHVKKEKKIEQFQQACEAINQFYSSIDTLSPRNKKALSAQFLALDKDKFALMIEDIKKIHAREDTRVPIFTALLAYFNTPDMSFERSELFSKIIMQFAEYQNTHKQIKIDDLLKDVQGFKECTIEKLQLLWQDWIQTPQAWWETETRSPVLAAIAGYFNTPTMSLEKSQLLSKIISQVADYQYTHPQIKIEHLLQGVARFKECDEEQLKLLLELMEKNDDHDHTIEPLFDNTLFYLTKDINKDKRKEVQALIQTFYKAAKSTQAAPVEIMKDPQVKALFQFNNEHTREQRILWMRLLHNQVFVTNHGDEDNHDYRFDKANNEALTEHGLNQYTKYTGEVLKRKPAKDEVSHIRDLTTSQQKDLLSVADELRVVGNPKTPLKHNKTANAQKMINLHSDLNTLIKDYESSWFRSLSRRVITREMKGQLKELFETTPNYQNVLKAIYEAKKLVVQEDLRAEKTSWFSMHRSGESRLYNTLNKMEDMVLSHWAQNSQKLTEFQEYQSVNQQVFNESVTRLQNALREHKQATYPEIYEDRYEQMGYRAARFFGDKKKEATVNSILDALSTFERLAKGAHEIRQLKNVLTKEALSKLPGHLAALANDVIMRSESLADNLEEQNKFEAIKDIFKK
jgi:hypothetical protein